MYKLIVLSALALVGCTQDTDSRSQAGFRAATPGKPDPGPLPELAAPKPKDAPTRATSEPGTVDWIAATMFEAGTLLEDLAATNRIPTNVETDLLWDADHIEQCDHAKIPPPPKQEACEAHCILKGWTKCADDGFRCWGHQRNGALVSTRWATDHWETLPCEEYGYHWTGEEWVHVGIELALKRGN